jgi:hypothetical protein
VLQLEIPDGSGMITNLSGIGSAVATYLVISAWFVGSSDERREFRQSSGVPTPSCATDLVIVGAVRPIPDVSGIPNGHYNG